MHQVGLYETRTGVLLKEQIVGEKQNELSIVSEFLTPLWVKGRILSADALHTQKTFCATVDAYAGFYLLIAKGNQPTLRDDLHLFFSEPPPDRDWRTAQTLGKGHGRLERRELVATTELNDFLSSNWPGVAQVFRLTRTTERSGKLHQEVVYGLTDLSPALATASDLLRLQREHWAIGAIRFAETSESSGMASKEVKRSLTTDRVMWDAIPHPLGERGNAAPSR